ncbi:amidase [Bordetella sp. BOR01]|uniref:amidase n=1 Tax=Bordetella sp. BOR01 TaxID=2854779 RepID=UPI001C4633F1|nr:amidase [Bordetella sp. BOR01]MBV7483377.1 amidase [Bordetella sp. BOR01]
MRDMPALLDIDLCEAARRIRVGEVSSEALTRLALARARAVQPQVNCFIAIDEQQALEDARVADRAVACGKAPGALHGVPLAHKDMFYRAGRITTGGSKLLADYRPTITATVAQRLQDAGAIWLGALHMAEFAANPIGQNASYGDCRNAWDRTRISGGSSSGSAVAVALRACYGSLGSDTGGSIRMPAALNGVVGLRPTYGRVSRYGILPRTWSMDTVGPLARTARDCARLLGVIAGADPQDATASSLPVPDYEEQLTGSIEGLRIAVPVNYFYDETTPEVRQGLERSLGVLAGLGARVVEVSVPDPARLYQLGNLISQVEAAAIHADLVQRAGDEYPLVLKTRMQSGAYVPAVDYLGALSARARLAREFATAVFACADVLHVPVISMAAPTLEEVSPVASSEVFPLLARTARCTRPFSTLGMPALSVPAGFTPQALPIAFQLVGRPFSEGLLLRVADAYQRATDWHTRAPIIPTI